MRSDHLYQFRCRYTGVVKAYKRMSSRKAAERNGLLSAEGSTHQWAAVAGALPEEDGFKPQAERSATTASASALRVTPALCSGALRPR